MVNLLIWFLLFPLTTLTSLPHVYSSYSELLHYTSSYFCQQDLTSLVSRSSLTQADRGINWNIFLPILSFLVSTSVYTIECETCKGKEHVQCSFIKLQGWAENWSIVSSLKGWTSDKRINTDYAMLMVKVKHTIGSLTYLRKICLLIDDEKEKIPSKIENS